MPFSFEFFDMGLYRMGTDCEKWDTARRDYGANLLPLWVADMDFKSPPQVHAALLNRAAHPTYGYTEISDKDYVALIEFWKRRHGLEIKQEQIIMLPCVVSGLKTAVQTFTSEGDGVVIQPPVYGPFFSAVTQNKRLLIENPLIHDADGTWRMDLNHLETLFKDGAKMMLLCNPHNPISRAWSGDEIDQLVRLCEKYGVYLVSDEIHADFVFKPKRFVSVLEMNYDRSIMLCAASKTFNLAGLQQASLVAQNPSLYDKLNATVQMNGLKSGNLFALCATRVAYEQGDAWLDGVLAYLQEGRDLLYRTLNEQLPLCQLSPIEATYLAFLDLRAYGLTNEEMNKRTLNAEVMFTSGTFFSSVYGDGFLRFNFACPHRFITEGVKRLKMALER